MGACVSNIRAKVIPGVIRTMSRVDFDAADEEDYFELNGMPMHHFVDTLGISKEAQTQLISEMMEAGSTPCKGSPRPMWAKGMYFQAARVEVFSWNVGSLADSRSSRGVGIDGALKGDVKQLLARALGVGKGKGHRADVIVVGLQEMISLSIDNAVTGAPRSSLDSVYNGWPETVVQWVDLFREAINSCVNEVGKTESRHSDQLYVPFGQPVYLFGMLLCVFCLPELIGTHLHQFGMFEMAADRQETGVKGVVACRFVLYDRSFCFVNGHFHADTSRTDEMSQKDLEERIKQINHCLRSIEFAWNDQLMHPLAAHRAVFLLGDTNMRLTRPEDYHSWPAWRSHVQERIQEGDLRSLDVHDQLQTIQKAQGRALYVVNHPLKSLSTKAARQRHLLREPLMQQAGGPPFPPTYKLAVPGPGYSEKRVPAWTDRILYRSPDVKAVLYEAVQQEQIFQPPRNITDHNPVYALFQVDCVRMNRAILQVQLRKAVRRSGEQPTEQIQQLNQEQERHFRWRFVNTGRPHIELLAQRIFEMLKEEGLDGQDLTLVADKLVRTQQDCWRIICDRMEDHIQRALQSQREKTDSSVQLLDQTLRQLSADITEALERAESENSFGTDSQQVDAKGLLQLRQRSRRAEQWRRRWPCWAACYEGVWLKNCGRKNPWQMNRKGLWQ